MFSKRCSSVVIIASFLVMAGGKAVSQDVNREQLERIVSTFDKLPKNSPLRHQQGRVAIYNYAKRLLRTTSDGAGTDIAPAESQEFMADVRSAEPAVSLAAAPAIALLSGVVPVSDPRRDFQLSPDAGFTQNGTSVAWCGNNVAIGFQDTGAALRTLSSPDNRHAESALNVGVSSDAGAHFRMLDHLPAGKGKFTQLFGSPSLACSSATNFYFVTSGVFGDDPGLVDNVTISSSTNGGQSWSDPIPLISQPIGYEQYDGAFIAVDPHNPSNVYVAYAESADGVCGSLAIQSSIRLLHSADGGRKWQQSTVADLCEDGEVLEAPQIAIDSKGRLYVLFSDSGDFGETLQLLMAVSTDHGAGFGAIKPVMQVQYPGQSSMFGDGPSGALQGGAYAGGNVAMAIDPRTDKLWITWDDGRNNIRGFGSSTAKYAYSDILFITSSDGGQTWTRPKAVSPVSHSFTGVGRDQFSPTLAIDQTGTVAICYYDRRNDRNNFSVDRYCSLTSNNGLTWQDQRKTANSFLITPNVDALSFGAGLIGGDSNTTDHLRTRAGFIGAFTIVNSGNPDVYAARF